MLIWIKNKWLSLIRFFYQTNEYTSILTVTESPPKVPFATLIIVMGEKQPKWLKLRCPCGCKTEISLPLMVNHNPHWKVKQENGGLTVLPSINIISPGCGAHFWIVKNKVKWAELG